MSSKRLSPDLDHLLKRYLAGEALEPLAIEHGIGQGWLRKQFLERGVVIRTKSDAMRLRLAQIGSTGRKQLALAANKACRGRKRSLRERQQGALTRSARLQNTDTFVGRFETQIQVMLEARGIQPTPQQAVCGYNLDLGIKPVAVEVMVTANNPLSDVRHRKRTKKLIEAGWSVLYVWITKAHPLSNNAADEIATFIKKAKRNPTPIGQYRVIRGSGEAAPTRLDLD